MIKKSRKKDVIARNVSDVAIRPKALSLGWCFAQRIKIH